MILGTTIFLFLICLGVCISEAVLEHKFKKAHKEQYITYLENTVRCQERTLMHYKFEQWTKDGIL